MLTKGLIIFALGIIGLISVIIWILISISLKDKREKKMLENAISNSKEKFNINNISHKQKPKNNLSSSLNYCEEETMSLIDEADTCDNKIENKNMSSSFIYNNSQVKLKNYNNNSFEKFTNHYEDDDITESLLENDGTIDDKTESLIDYDFKFCTRCGAKNSVDFRFCSVCGQKLI